MEGVFTPEIWIHVAEKTGIEELRLTTRDISDYDVLMKRRLKILEENRLTLADIQAVIAKLEPLEGALPFLEWLRSRTQVVIVSDTFNQFAGPLMEKLGWPALLCNTLEVDPEGRVTGYRLRQADGKRMVVLAFKSLYYRIAAVGDSYNDISMLQEADEGILFKPPDPVREQYPELPVTYTYGELREVIGPLLTGTYH
jgi:phosphoserine/homoserine phosphotransferase